MSRWSGYKSLFFTAIIALYIYNDVVIDEDYIIYLENEQEDTSIQYYSSNPTFRYDRKYILERWLSDSPYYAVFDIFSEKYGDQFNLKVFNNNILVFDRVIDFKNIISSMQSMEIEVNKVHFIAYPDSDKFYLSMERLHVNNDGKARISIDYTDADGVAQNDTVIIRKKAEYKFISEFVTGFFSI